MYRTFREIAETVITAAIIFVALQAATQTFRVVGPSMDPTLIDGQHLLVNKFVYQTVGSDGVADLMPWVDENDEGDDRFLFRGPERGDIIVFEPPTGEHADFVKRVVGIPGDVVDIQNGKVFVNGDELEEELITRQRGPVEFPLTVPPDKYFVLGDNRGSSNDSRSWGVVDSESIVGRVSARYWPISDFKIF